MNCVIIRMVDVPLPFKGSVVRDVEGDYNMYLNARLSEDERVRTYWHEVEHIRLGHFDSDLPVAVKEAEAEKEAEKHGKEVRRTWEAI